MKPIYLDAMIPRADFCESDASQGQASKIQAINLQQLGPDSFLVPTLRKPDFQRETNQWSADQVVVFLKSFLDNELVPSVIFWLSPGKIFVIDGAHRLSALLAWINDDYGDGHISKNFFGSNISKEQRISAESLRKKINREIGNYKAYTSAMQGKVLETIDPIFIARANNARIRSVDLQWVEGDAEKAESSFFKINQQGTALDPTEERLLRLRRTAMAIAARSVVRAATGHKYWSQFEKPIVNRIEQEAKNMHALLFSPEIDFPIKTLNLPHGGKASPISAYNLLMDLFCYAVAGDVKANKNDLLFGVDNKGENTVAVLEKSKLVMRRLTGNGIESLGLHPAVYFYSHSGKHWDVMFLAVVKVFSKAIRNNDGNFFKEFTKNRRPVEELLINNKALLGQANIAIRSKLRVEKWAEFFEKIARGSLLANVVTASDILDALDLKGAIIASELSESGPQISDETKSTVFLKSSLDSAKRCPLCGGYVQVEKSVSYDHITPKSKGGDGSEKNVQLTHPYCNSLKGST